MLILRSHEYARVPGKGEVSCLSAGPEMTLSWMIPIDPVLSLVEEGARREIARDVAA